MDDSSKTKKELIEELQTLRRRQSALHRLLENLPDVVFELDTDGKILFTNRTVLGRTKEKVVGSSCFDLIAPEYHGMFRETIRKIFDTGEFGECELELIAPDGTRIWHHTHIGTVKHDGNVVAALGISTDVTEQKKAQRILEESQARLTLAEQIAHIGHWDWHIDTGKVIWSDETCRIFGLDPQTFEPESGNLLTRVAPEQREIIIQTRDRAFRGETPCDLEFNIIRDDGQQRIVRSQAKVFFDAENKPVRVLGTVQDITERKRAADQLTEERNKLQSIIGAMVDGLSIHNRQYEIIYQNDVLRKLFGDHLGEKCYHIYEGKDHVCEDCPVKMAFDDGQSHTSERQVIMPSGDFGYWENTASPVRDASGNIVACLEIARDVTDRKWAEQALRASEERYRTLFEGASEGILVADIETRKFKYANPAICKILGFNLGDLINKELSDIHPVESLAYVIEQFEAQISGEKYLAPEIPCLRKDGSIMYADIGATKVEIDGRLCMVGFLTDITDRKRAQDNLEKSEQKYRCLVENLEREYFFYSNNTDGVFTYISPSIQNVLKYSQEEFQTCYTEFLTDNPVNKEAVRHSDLSIAGKTQLPYQVEIYDKDGSIHMLEVSEAPVFDEKGTVIAVDGIAHDITEFLCAKEELQKAHDELEMRVEQRTADLAKLNKELRSEIAERKRAENTLLVYQERLRSLASEQSLSEERLRRRIATELHDHIGQNLAISKINLDSLCSLTHDPDITKSLQQTSELIAKTIESSRTLTFELSPPVLYELGLEAALEWLVRQARERHNLKTEFETDGQQKSLEENVRVLIFQAVRELIINVVKHANAANIHVKTNRIGEQIQIIVEDDGSGFDTSKLSTGESQTGGFGLFSIRERIENVGGKLELKSKRDKGTKVILTAPIKKKKNYNWEK